MSKKKPTACPVRKTSIGGQALMEGIMMRGPKTTAMAVRNPQGEIILETISNETKKRPAICRWPVIRGVFGFIDSMSLGYKCLMRSAEISGLEELEAEMEREKAEKKAAKKAAKKASRMDAPTESPDTENPASDVSVDDVAVTAETPAVEETETAPAAVADVVKKEKKESSAMMTVLTVVSMIFGFAIAIGLFIILPAWLYDGVLARYIPWVDGENRFAQSIFEGLLRVILLVGYMSLMLLMKDVRRTFQFHGAEHKTIFCYEHGLELTVENVRRERRFHPRCGTSFLVLMMLVSIVVGFFIPATFPTILRVLCKIAVFPLIMGLGFELIKFCGRHDNWLTRLISLPGVWLQHITVLEPDDSMIECAIVAMKEVIPSDESDAW